MTEYLDLARSRRKDPNYIQVSVDLPKPLALKLKAVCVMNELSQSEAVEEAVVAWLKSRGEGVPDYEPPAESD